MTAQGCRGDDVGCFLIQWGSGVGLELGAPLNGVSGSGREREN